MVRSIALLPLLFVACASADRVRESDPAAEDRAIHAAKEDAKRRDFRVVLIRLDQAIDSYVQALANQGEYRADEQAERLERLIHDTVLDLGPIDPRKPREDTGPRDTFRKLQALAIDGSNPRQQAIALAALGFSDLPEVLPTLEQGAMLSNPDVVDGAVLGLAVLRSPNTKFGLLASIATNPEHPEDGRAQAAWALYRIQGRSSAPAEILAAWQRMLTEHRDQLPPSVLMTAVRGLGLSRDASHSDLVTTFLAHPTPKVRMAAALALGRMNAQHSWQKLLELLGPQETVQNVRLVARKALVALAGGVDHGYDIDAWRKTFDRG